MLPIRVVHVLWWTVTGTTVYVVAVLAVIPIAGAFAWFARIAIRRKVISIACHYCIFEKKFLLSSRKKQSLHIILPQKSNLSYPSLEEQSLQSSNKRYTGKQSLLSFHRRAISLVLKQKIHRKTISLVLQKSNLFFLHNSNLKCPLENQSLFIFRSKCCPQTTLFL